MTFPNIYFSSLNTQYISYFCYFIAKVSALSFEFLTVFKAQDIVSIRHVLQMITTHSTEPSFVRVLPLHRKLWWCTATSWKRTCRSVYRISSGHGNLASSWSTRSADLRCQKWSSRWLYWCSWWSPWCMSGRDGCTCTRNGTWCYYCYW